MTATSKSGSFPRKLRALEIPKHLSGITPPSEPVSALNQVNDSHKERSVPPLEDTIVRVQHRGSLLPRFIYFLLFSRLLFDPRCPAFFSRSAHVSFLYTIDVVRVGEGDEKLLSRGIFV